MPPKKDKDGKEATAKKDKDGTAKATAESGKKTADDKEEKRPVMRKWRRKPRIKNFRIECRHPNTVALMLNSPELAVKLQALDGLYGLANDWSEEVQVRRGIEELLIETAEDEDSPLEKKDLVTRVWSLVDGPETENGLDMSEMQAAAYNLMSALWTNFPTARRRITAASSLELYVLTAFKHYSNPVTNPDTDVIVREMASFFLSKLSANEAVRQLLHITTSVDLNKFYIELKSSDPDIQYNSLVTVFNLMRDEDCVNTMLNLKEFYFAPIVDLMWSEFLELQYLAAEVVHWLLTLPKLDPTLYKLFLEEKCLAKILEILEVYEWEDMHLKVFDMLDKMCAVCDQFADDLMYDAGGYSKILDYIDTIDDDYLIEAALRLLVNMEQFECIRKTLVSEGMKERMVTLFEGLITKGTKEMKLLSCRGLGGLWDLILFRNNKEILGKVVALARVPTFTWNEKSVALTAILAAVQCSHAAIRLLYPLYPSECFAYHLLETPRKMSKEQALTIARILKCFVSDNTVGKHVLTPSFVSALIRCCQDADENLITCGAEGLTIALKKNKMGLRIFEAERGLQKLVECVLSVVSRRYHTPETKNRLIDVFNRLLAVIIDQILDDPVAMDDLIRCGILEWAIDNKGRWEECPGLKEFTEMMLDVCPSAKLCYTRQLCIGDITQDGFYTTKQRLDRFRSLSEYASTDTVVYFLTFRKPESSDDEAVSTAQRKCLVQCASRSSTEEKEPKGGSWQCGGGDCEEELSVGSSGGPRDAPDLPPPAFDDDEIFFRESTPIPSADPYLHDLLRRLKDELKITEDDYSPETAGNRKRVLEKIEAISKLVVEKLSQGGKTDKDLDPFCCNTSTLDLHISQLIERLKCSIIPMGNLRVGGKLERAILFKCLADRVNLLCGLVLGEYGSAWVEVSVPEPVYNRKIKIPVNKVMPNYIVDLVIHPGNLLSIDSDDADRYCCKPVKFRLKKKCY